MGVCRATKRDGTRCTLPANGKHGLCWAHSPETAEARRKRASRGGKAKAARKVAGLWDKVEDVIVGVEAERLSPSQGNTMIKGYTTLIALDRLDVERSELEIAQRRLELDEQERLEVLARIEELEEMEKLRKERERWGLGTG
jgi:hypothetical protein